MDEIQAEQTVLAVEQTWKCDLGEARNLWLQAVLPFDSLTAAAAIIKLSERSRDRPSIAELREMITEITAEKIDHARAQLPAKRDPHPETRTTGKKNEPPEWTHIWSWLRFKQNDFRRLPQQDAYDYTTGTSLEEMTRADYEDVRQKWIAEGSPRVTPEEVSSGLARTIASL